MHTQCLHLDWAVQARLPPTLLAVHAPPPVPTPGWCLTLTETLKDGQSSSGSKGCGEREQKLVFNRHVLRRHGRMYATADIKCRTCLCGHLPRSSSAHARRACPCTHLHHVVGDGHRDAAEARHQHLCAGNEVAVIADSAFGGRTRGAITATARFRLVAPCSTASETVPLALGKVVKGPQVALMLSTAPIPAPSSGCKTAAHQPLRHARAAIYHQTNPIFAISTPLA